MARSFDELVTEAEHAPVTDWDFSFLEGRATEERPSWRYFDRVAERVTGVSSVLDLSTGSGRMLDALPALPSRTVATEAHAPSITVAAPRLRRVGAHVVAATNDALPFAGESFELVISRHPVFTSWDEVARVLVPGGTYFSQQVGPHSLRDLGELLVGPLAAGSTRDPSLAAQAAERVGLVVTDLREERLRVEFFDIGAVVFFLRLVVWIVPGFTVDRYRGELRALHQQIERHGRFVTTSSRFLVEATKPR